MLLELAIHGRGRNGATRSAHGFHVIHADPKAYLGHHGRRRANSWKFYSHATDDHNDTRTRKFAEI